MGTNYHLVKEMNQETGYTLIEIIASLVIVGIIATFSSLFLVVGLEGYEFTRKAADAAMKTEVALNRISLELRAINSISSYTENSSISYTSSDNKLAEGIKFASNGLFLTVNGNDRKLIDDVSNPLLFIKSYDTDFDGDGENDVAYIDVGFSLSGMPDFEVRVYPRNMVSMP
jgi:prepilin-type N-terminal cleavage/methylation domain-containing protein